MDAPTQIRGFSKLKSLVHILVGRGLSALSISYLLSSGVAKVACPLLLKPLKTVAACSSHGKIVHCIAEWMKMVTILFQIVSNALLENLHLPSESIAYNFFVCKQNIMVTRVFEIEGNEQLQETTKRGTKNGNEVSKETIFAEVKKINFLKK
nr:hypothetical protein CFP56_55276 [Quercus suber]